MRCAAAMAAIAVLFAVGEAHAWQERALHRDVLAVDRPVVELGPVIAEGDGPARVELRGSISSRVDGTTVDAVSRWSGDVRLRADAPWIVVPEGTTIVEEDPAAHRYVLAVPRSRDARIELAVRRLAHEHFLTPSELRERTTGAIEVRVLERVPEPAALARVAEAAGPARGAALAAGAASASLFLVLIAALASRRSRHADRALVRRARRAVRAVEREVDRLGPAFADVATSARGMLDGALAVQAHLGEVRDALGRTRRLSSAGAAERRLELHRQAREALDRLVHLVDRLEATATQLAARTAEHARARDIDARERDLDSDLDTAVSADAEAHG